MPPHRLTRRRRHSSPGLSPCVIPFPDEIHTYPFQPHPGSSSPHIRSSLHLLSDPPHSRINTTRLAQDITSTPQPRDKHDILIDQVLSQSRAKRTMSNYDSAIRTFKQFCEEAGFQARPASEKTLCSYVAHLASSKAGSTIANAISAIKFWHTSINAPWHESQRLRDTIKGAANLAPASSRRPDREPVTLEMLTAMASTIDPDDDEECAALAVALVAFWGQARLGELLGTSSRSFDPSRFPSRSDLSPSISSNGSRTLLLPCTKTSQTRGETIVITAQQGQVDPIAALERHLHLSRNLPASSHLFAFKLRRSNSSKILTRERFLWLCNMIWRRTDANKITGHCFRIGGTTHLLRLGVAPEIVKTMGRWNSDAFYRYWRDVKTISVQHAELISRSRNESSRSEGPLTVARPSGAPAAAQRRGRQTRRARLA